MMKNQKWVAVERGMPTEDVGGSSQGVSISGETVQFFYNSSGTRTQDAGQAAGVLVEAVFANAPILGASGISVGSGINSSLSFTSTAFTTEIKVPNEELEKLDGLSFANRFTLLAETVQKIKTSQAAGVVTAMANGDYVIDYRKGVAWGKKASTQTTLTSAAYKTRQRALAIASIIPGTSATSLGKAEDAAHTSGDTGVLALVVRSDTPANTAGTTGDYSAPINDSLGHLWNREGFQPGYENNTDGVASVAIKPLSTATNSWTIFQNLAANATLNIKAAPGNVKSIYCLNNNAAVRYIGIYNSATTASGTPVLNYMIPPAVGGVPGEKIIDGQVLGENGANFNTGIAFGFSTASNTYTAGTAADMLILEVMYK